VQKREERKREKERKRESEKARQNIWAGVFSNWCVELVRPTNSNQTLRFALNLFALEKCVSAMHCLLWKGGK